MIGNRRPHQLTAWLHGLAFLALIAFPTMPCHAAEQAPARITLIVPSDAEVFFDGATTTEKGRERLYATAPVEVGKKYYYEVLVRWKDGNKAVEQTRKVLFTGGGEVRIDFLSPPPPSKETLSEEAAFQLGIEAYVYGYPLVTMDVTRRVLTKVLAPKGTKAPMGQFANLRAYPTADFRDVTAPNADTLYSVAWLDLSREPWVLHVPEEARRYYLMPMLDAWTNVFADPGTRTTGTGAGAYAVTGPGWRGTLPQGVKQLKAPTNVVWIIGRTYCTGTPEDYKAVHVIQDKYSLTPLSAWGKQYTPPASVPVDPSVDDKTPPREQVNRMDAGTYFKWVAALMKDNPPAAADGPMIARLAKLGIVPGQAFDIGKLDPAAARGLERATKAGLEKIVAAIPRQGKHVNGWQITFTGDYGTDYLFRAAIAFAGLGANLARDACYPITEVDGDGQPLNGANNYVLHFASKKDLPPVNGFWSLTMYDGDYFFVANPLNRYTLSERNRLKENADGSIDLYLQHDPPGKDKESNWLPAPEGKFILCLRLYWPKEEFLKGQWVPAAVQAVR